MKILFLTNNHEVSLPLFDWLGRVEGAENVLLCEDKISMSQFLESGKSYDIGFIISYNYSHIVQPEIINRFPHRIINLHISLLPWNRGASPNIWSFLDGTPSGVTIHQLSEGLDTGDILLQEETSFDYAKETLKSSYNKLHTLIQRLFKDNWEVIKDGSVVPRRQGGAFTYHRAADLQPYKDILDYNDTIAEFLRKAALVKIPL